MEVLTSLQEVQAWGRSNKDIVIPIKSTLQSQSQVAWYHVGTAASRSTGSGAPQCQSHSPLRANLVSYWQGCKQEQ